ncbi:MAG: hypothetical protein ABI091_24645 [Ferruginibacter sp.]
MQKRPILPENYHLTASISKWNKNTYVNWSKKPQNKAVVFIHGFNGSSMDTFGDFNLEFRYRPEYEGYDVFFFGYNSLFRQIANSALGFLKFLRAIHNNIDQVIKESGINVTRQQYSKIVIVAHSLGAVITRVALNEGYKTESAWLDKCALVFFAPAHKGAKDEILGLAELHGFTKLISPVAKYFVVTLKQLMDKSIIINPMEIKVKALIDKNVTSFTIPKVVVWADPDRVVINDFFLEDPEPISLDGVKHEDVCKPSKKFEEPYKFVSDYL